MRRLRDQLIHTFFLLSTVLILSHCNSGEHSKTNQSSPNNNLIPYSVVTTYTHDPQSFTEGLVFHDGNIYESTGSDDSWVAQIDPATGAAIRKTTLSNKYFGEGITIWNNKIYQLTWKNKTGFIYNLATFNRIGEFHYSFEGWGLTHDDHFLIASDGSNKLYYIDTLDFSIKQTLHILENNAPATHLNELEFVDGMMYANQWETNYLLRIDPATGKVTGKLDLSTLTFQARLLNPDIDVLNGVASDGTGNLIVTGKYWPLEFVIRPEQPTGHKN